VTIAIVGDTHMPKGARRLPDRALEVLHEAELIVHTGDFTGLETLQLFAGLGPPIVAVAGNVDVGEIHARLPEATTIALAEGIQVGLIHDAGPRKGRLARMRRRFPGAAAVLFGHSHLPLHEREDPDDPASFQIFNPGSPTERRRAPGHSMGLGEVSAAGVLELRHIWLD
jgi:putative phosphoesterase